MGRSRDDSDAVYDIGLRNTHSHLRYPPPTSKRALKQLLPSGPPLSKPTWLALHTFYPYSQHYSSRS